MYLSSISFLIQRQYEENGRIYGIGAIVLFMTLLFMFLIVHQWQDSFSGAVQNGVFVIGLFISGAIFTNSVFGELSNPQSAMWLLSVPTTHAEKVITAVILSVPFFLITYLGIFYLADLIYLEFVATLNPPDILNLGRNNFYQFIFLYLTLNGFILLCSVVFNRFSLIKTILTAILIFIFINFLNSFMLSIFLPEVEIVSSTPFDSFIFSHHRENIAVSLRTNSNLMASLFIRGVLPLSFWIGTWLKLREKEIRP